MPPPPPVYLDPPEVKRSYSSSYNGLQASKLVSRSAWAAATNAAGEWLSIDAGQPIFIAGLVVMIRGDQDQLATAAQRETAGQRVTQVKVETSADGTAGSWAAVDNGATFATGLTKFTEPNDQVEVLFAAPVEARYFKVIVQAWNAWPAMRCGLIMGGHMGGVQVSDPPDSARTYSSSFGDIKYSMLSSTTAWAAASKTGSQWMKIDMGSALLVLGVRTKSRGDHATQRVTKYTVQVSDDDTTWSNVDGGATFSGTDAANDEVDAIFATPVRARYIKIVVKDHIDWIAMRAGVLTRIQAPPSPPPPF